jgi:hypothetical protein
MQNNKANTLVKRRWKVCQGKSEVLTRFLRGEDHIFDKTAAAAAIRGVNVPIGAPDVVAGRESKSAGGSVDRLRGAFELEEGPHGRFIQVQVKPRKLESGPKFLVDEAGAEAQGPESTEPESRFVHDQLAFEAFLVPCAA